MNRRRFLVGAGTLAAGSGGLVSSGAFTRVEANRRIDIGIAADDRAFLSLDVIDGEIARQNESDILELTLDEEHPKEADGEGIAPNSVYEITGVAADRIFDIENFADRTLDVYGYTVEQEGPQVELFDVTDSSHTAIDSAESAVTLSTGEFVKVGIRIIVPGDAEIKDYNQTVRIKATE
jgi:hypothetical protein